MNPLKSPAIFTHPEAGVLRFQGRDRLDFLQRQSTNDVHLLSPARSVTTALTNPAARILDVLQLVQETEEAFIALPLPGRAAATFQYLKSRIFFMDQVQLQDISPDYFYLDLHGEKAAELLREIGIAQPPSLNEVVRGSLEGAEIQVIGQRGLFGPGFRLLTSSEKRDSLLQTLSGLGALTLSPEAFEIYRVEAGLPSPSAELSEAYTPLEVNLQEIISTTKGCYTGQEVIARQITYDKITRRLTGLVLDSPVPPGTRLTAAKKPIGRVTSCVRSPRFGPIALAVLKRPHDEPGSEVLAVTDEGTVRGKVSSIPFG